jgi:hypothetical protein
MLSHPAGLDSFLENAGFVTKGGRALKNGIEA